MNITQLNELLADRLGRNPYGEPLYKWVHSDSFMHHMKDISGLKEVTLPSGLIVMEPIYIERKACPQFTDTWLIAHWHEPEPESLWLAKYGTKALWPRRGYYTQTNAFEERGQFPRIGITEKLIELVKQIRAKSAADLQAEGEKIIEQEERDASNTRTAMIGDACTAYGNIPGSRSSDVSLPLPGVDYSAPFQQRG